MRKLSEKPLSDREAAHTPETQTEAYYRALHSWQEKEGARYALPQESLEEDRAVTFVQGKGFHADSPPAVKEKKAITQIFTAIGYAMLAYLAIEYILIYGVVSLLQMAGVDITYYYDSGYFCGNTPAVLLLLLIDKVLKYVVPILILGRCFRLPHCVAAPMKPVKKAPFLYSIPMILITFVALNLWHAVVPHSVIQYSTLGTTYHMLSYAGQYYQIFYLIFEFLFSTWLTSILFSGICLQVLRQFGDRFALLMTAGICALMRHELIGSPIFFVVYCICCYATLRSGSFLAGFFDLLLYRLLLFSLYQMENIGGNWAQNRIFFLLGILAIGIIWIICLLCCKTLPDRLPAKKTALPPREKATSALHVVSFSILIFLCILLAVVNLIF